MITPMRIKGAAVIVAILVMLLVFQMYQRPDFLVMMSQLIWSCF